MRQITIAAVAVGSLSVGGCAGIPEITGVAPEQIPAMTAQICKFHASIETVLEILAIVDPTRIATVSNSVANHVVKAICKKVTAGGPQSSHGRVLHVKNPDTGKYQSVRIRGDFVP